MDRKSLSPRSIMIFGPYKKIQTFKNNKNVRKKLQTLLLYNPKLKPCYNKQKHRTEMCLLIWRLINIRLKSVSVNPRICHAFIYFY